MFLVSLILINFLWSFTYFSKCLISFPIIPIEKLAKMWVLLEKSAHIQKHSVFSIKILRCCLTCVDLEFWFWNKQLNFRIITLCVCKKLTWSLTYFDKLIKTKPDHIYCWYSKCSKISNIWCLPKRHRQTVAECRPDIRLFLKMQSDQGLPCFFCFSDKHSEKFQLWYPTSNLRTIREKWTFTFTVLIQKRKNFKGKCKKWCSSSVDKSVLSRAML